MSSRSEAIAPSPRLNAPLATDWAPWAEATAAIAAKAWRMVASRQRQARRVTVTVRLGRGRTRSLAAMSPIPTEETCTAAALGLLRLLMRTHGHDVVHVAVRLDRLVSSADAPADFRRYWRRRENRRSRIERWLGRWLG